MKKITLFLFYLTFLFSINIVGQVKKKAVRFGNEFTSEKRSPDGHIRCATDEYEAFLQANHPERMNREQFETFLASSNKSNNKDNLNEINSQSGGIIYIPVVVHVIHNGDAYGVNENITDEQVQSQITVMNQDYRRMAGTPGFNNNAVGADVQIEFVLAKVDPNGNPTNGINRVNLCQAYWEMGTIDSTVKPTTIWNPTQYMNMWSVNFGGTSADLLGYAQFPSNGTTTANTDGVVAGYSYFGSQSIYPAGNFSAPYNQGRTMTHEVGHFLGLYHTFQGGCSGENATAGDLCADTPAVRIPNYGCTPINTCPTGANDMIANYMDYTDDSCMNIFTANQKSRITSVMNTFPRRLDLKSSTKDQAIPLFANDAEVIIENLCVSVQPTCTSPNPTSPAKSVLLYNRGTSNLTSATLSYNMNGGTSFSQNWTGNLAPNKYALVTLTNSTINGLLTVSIASANGTTDQRTTNNTATKTFGTSGSLAYANSTSFTFNLTGDAYGNEITWTLKNQAGTTLYSGGTYTEEATGGTYPLVTNQVWNLPANGCYYLTVNDSYGDGLFDGVGQGYYTVTAGSTTVVNVTDFVASGNPANTPISRVSYFTNNATLSTDTFNLLEDVSLYPNPSNSFFTINVPDGIERTGKIEIYNNLGQRIDGKSIQSESDLNVNVSSYADGVYFLNLTIGGGSKTLKFIKN
ncbi:MAG: T9SS C-terminal target domain-containing protein [Flavobacteriia bacterium]|jgi:hypothetical protein|uniref:M43 family zinc metalloprotease n=1 Tax=Flavobacterium sp. TaxID=239 RepID=UPI002972925A|nr:MAG: T9SS C-terminal target domain-containing protein [Flavobacteriia bacterium]